MKKRRYLKCLLLLLLITNHTNAKNFLFKGTIGKYPIYLEYDEKYKSCSYFYIGQPNCITSDDVSIKYSTFNENEIKYSSSKLNLNIVVKIENRQTKKEIIILNIDETKASGFWYGTSHKKKKKLPIKLILVDKKKILAPFNQFKSKYEALELAYLSTLKFKLDTSYLQQKLKIHWYKELISNISFFRLDNQYYRGVNNILLDKHIEKILNKFYNLNCDSDDEHFFELDLFDDKLLSFVHKLGFCNNGWSENFVYENITIDLLGQKKLYFDDIFRFSNDYNPNSNITAIKDLQNKLRRVLSNQKPNKKEISEDFYRENILAPAIVELLKKTYPDLRKTPLREDEEDIGECYYLDSDLWKYPEDCNWHLKSNGLALIFHSGPRGFGPCSETFVFPYSSLRKYITDEYQSVLKN